MIRSSGWAGSLFAKLEEALGGHRAELARAEAKVAGEGYANAGVSGVPGLVPGSAEQQQPDSEKQGQRGERHGQGYIQGRG